MGSAMYGAGGAGGRGGLSTPARPGAAAAVDESADAVVLELCGITKVFPGVRANDRVDLLVRRG